MSVLIKPHQMTTEAKLQALTGQARIDMINALYAAMEPIQGETRAIHECGWCGKLWGHRYIPFSLGRGYMVNLCLCQCTSSNAPIVVVEERTP